MEKLGRTGVEPRTTAIAADDRTVCTRRPTDKEVNFLTYKPRVPTDQFLEFTPSRTIFLITEFTQPPPLIPPNPFMNIYDSHI